MSTERSAFIEPEKRIKTVPLDYPLTFEGINYLELTIRRCTAKEILAYATAIQELAENKSEARLPLPTIQHSQELLDALDADDHAKIMKAANDFLPLAFKSTAIE